jgi:hypothetical protein
MVIKSKTKKYNMQTKSSLIHIEETNKIPIFKCSCGACILIVPDLPAKKKAIKTHLIEHKKITGKLVDEDIITQAL